MRGRETSVHSVYILIDLFYFFVFYFFINSKRGTRRGTRRISIHPNFIQRFSTSNSGGQGPTLGSSALRVPSDARPRSGTSYTAETVASSPIEIQTEHVPAADQKITQEDSVSEIHGNAPQSGEAFIHLPLDTDCAY